MKINKTKLKWIIVITLFCVDIVLFKNSPFSKEISVYLSKKPETFTELYFTDHLSPPRQIKLKTPYLFKFTAHNLEYKDFTYFYEVTAEDGENKLTLDKGQFFLRHDETRTIPVTFRILKPFERTKITVTLVNKNQTVHFWVET